MTEVLNGEAVTSMVLIVSQNAKTDVSKRYFNTCLESVPQFIIQLIYSRTHELSVIATLAIASSVMSIWHIFVFELSAIFLFSFFHFLSNIQMADWILFFWKNATLSKWDNNSQNRQKKKIPKTWYHNKKKCQYC